MLIDRSLAAMSVDSPEQRKESQEQSSRNTSTGEKIFNKDLRAAKMGIPHKALSGMEVGAGFSRMQILEVGPTRTQGRRKGVEARPVSEVTQDAVAQQRMNKEVGERILALYDEYRPRLFRYIRSMNLERDHAEEVIQETFLRLTTRLTQEDDVDNVQGWIVRVAHNVAIDMLKRNHRDSAGNSDRGYAFETCVDPTPNPEQAYSQKEQIDQMQTVLRSLSPQQRRCFDLRAQGFRYKDIGQAFGISEQRAALIVKQASVRLAALCG